MSAPCTPTAGHVLFPGGDQTAFPVQGAAECLSPFMTALPAHDAALRALHEDLNHGRDAGAQAEIDRHIVACAAEVGGLRAAPAVEALVLARPAVSVHDCLDLGVYVRQALVRSGTLGCAGVQKLVQYSIPFVKHNRLTFPPLAAAVRLRRCTTTCQLPVLCRDTSAPCSPAPRRGPVRRPPRSYAPFEFTSGCHSWQKRACATTSQRTSVPSTVSMPSTTWKPLAFGATWGSTPQRSSSQRSPPAIAARQ